MIRFLLIAHGVLAFTAVLSATHHAAHAILAATGRQQARALLRFGWIAPLALVAQTLAGLLLYPAYRVQVRALDFDRNAPGVAALFDFKEHLGALSLALVIGAALAGRAAAREPQERAARWSLAAISSTGAAFLWVATILGLYVTARHPVGMP